MIFFSIFVFFPSSPLRLALWENFLYWNPRKDLEVSLLSYIGFLYCECFSESGLKAYTQVLDALYDVSMSNEMDDELRYHSIS